MEEVREPLLEMFTDDPVNWVKWAVVFTVLVVGYILAFKIYSKIEYHLSVQKKADQARTKGHVIENAKLIKVRKKGTYQERKEKHKTTYSATYRYTLDGKEKEYHAYFGNNYPPETIHLYYKNSPRKLFSVEEYYWQAPVGVLYLALFFMPFVLAALTGLAIGVPGFTQAAGIEQAEELKTGEFVRGPYQVKITAPEEGSRDVLYDWITSYHDEEEELDLEIQLKFVYPPRSYESGKEPEKAVLWGHEVLYETIMIQNPVREDREQELCRAYIVVEENQYLQIDIFGTDEIYTPVYKILEDEKFQNSFTLEYTKMF